MVLSQQWLEDLEEGQEFEYHCKIHKNVFLAKRQDRIRDPMRNQLRLGGYPWRS